MKRRIPAIVLNIVLVAGAILVAAPLVWMFSASFMPAGEASAVPPRLIPSRITLENYRELFTRLALGRSFLNSIIVAFSATALSLLINSMAGYAFAKLRFPHRDHLFRMLIAGLAIPSQVSMLPLFLLMKYLGLVNTYWGVIIPSMASIFGIFLVRQYMMSIPDELLDAARVDGASEFRIYWSVVLPLARPVLATLAIFTFMGTWNDFMWPLIILNDARRYTLPVAIANLSGEHVQDIELMMASAVLTLLPVLVLFVALQRQYIAGITAGSVKG